MSHSTNIARSFLALLFCCLLLGGLLGKALHVHGDSHSEPSGKQEQAELGKISHCDACVYQLNQEGFEWPDFTLAAPQKFPASHQACFRSHQPGSVGLSYSDRGPPVA